MIINIIACVLPFSIMTAAECKKDFYFKIAGGGSVFQDSSLRNKGLSADPLLQVGGGFVFKERFRTDLSFIYKRTSTRNVSVNTISLRQYSFLLNLYYDFPTRSIFTSYFTAGAGYAISRANLITVIPSCDHGTQGAVGVTGVPCTPNTRLITPVCRSTGASFNVGMGSAIKLSRHASLDLGYQFRILPRLKSDVSQPFRNLNDHSIMLGLTYRI